jgi:hypothetical protein
MEHEFSVALKPNPTMKASLSSPDYSRASFTMLCKDVVKEGDFYNVFSAAVNAAISSSVPMVMRR